MEERPLIVGAVAVRPESLLVWEGIRAHFLDLGAPMDFTLYSNYDRLTDQLVAGAVDIAWLSPLAYIRARRKAGMMVAPLLVGDNHRDLRSHVVMGERPAEFVLSGLHGSTLAVGSKDSAAARILPLHFFRQAGLDTGLVRILPMEVDVGKGGETLRAELDILHAVRERRASAGVVSDPVWKSAAPRAEFADLSVVWSSPPYDGAVFCALGSLPTGLRNTFERTMWAMNEENPRHRPVLERCGVSGWVPAREAGYASLRRAVEELALW